MTCPIVLEWLKRKQHDTPGKINMEPENGPLEDYSPLQPRRGFQVPYWVSSRVYCISRGITVETPPGPFSLLLTSHLIEDVSTVTVKNGVPSAVFGKDSTRLKESVLTMLTSEVDGAECGLVVVGPPNRYWHGFQDIFEG